MTSVKGQNTASPVECKNGGRPPPAETSDAERESRKTGSPRGLFSCSFRAEFMRHCIYPGTFDPITYGHLDVLARAAKLFDRVTVAIAENAGKGPLFSTAQRLELVGANVRKFPNVSVTSFGGLLVDFALAQKADAIIRGLRALSDFEFEFNMALMNRHLQPKIETIFVMPNEQFSYTSSSLVKQVAKFGGDVSHFVPADVAAALKEVCVS
jgi:pantetheine-phosphate adenylyltransferase